MEKMRPVSELDAGGVQGIFFDLDDTFTSGGKVTPEAYSALWRLKEANKIVVPITGRPAGWCDHIARMWPVDGVVGENGAFYFMMKDGKMVKEYTADSQAMEANRKRLNDICAEIVGLVPGAAVSSDQGYREFDLSIDYNEDVGALSTAEIDKIMDVFARHGANAKLSSVHINGWFGNYDKLTTVKKFMKKELGMDPDADNEKFVYCGDSPNDEPMFGYFKNSVGVANLMEFKDRLKIFPKYITKKAAGLGFSELSERIISGR